MKLIILILSLVAVALLALRSLKEKFPLRLPLYRDLCPGADVYGAVKTALRTNPISKASVKKSGARIRYMEETYTQSGAGNIGDVIHLPPLPVGAEVIAHLSRVDWSDGQATATLAVGKTGAAAALLAATSVENAGGSLLTSPADGADNVTIDTDEELIATNAGAELIDGQVVKFRIAYIENS